MELSNSNIKKFLIFQETETPKKLLIFSQKKVVFWKTETPKKFFLFQEREAPKKFLISQEVTFQASKVKNFLYFRK